VAPELDQVTFADRVGFNPDDVTGVRLGEEVG